MFNSDMFEHWLDNKAAEIVNKMGQGDQLKTEEMMVLVLKPTFRTPSSYG